MEMPFDDRELSKNMLLFKTRFHAAMNVFCENGAQKMEKYAKEHRPWTDRTGMARNSLKGSWERESDGYVIEIAHGVDYGVYLEFAHERKYAILLPTIKEVGKKEILPAFKNFIDKIKI